MGRGKVPVCRGKKPEAAPKANDFRRAHRRAAAAALTALFAFSPSPGCSNPAKEGGAGASAPPRPPEPAYLSPMEPTLQEMNEELPYLARLGEDEKAREFLLAGADPDSADPEGNTLLMISASFGRSGLVKLLLEHGASVDAENRDGRTALSFACRRGDTESIKMLLEEGADMYRRDEIGLSPVEYAMLGRKADALKLLLEEGADPNLKRSGEGEPLLLYAVHLGSVELVGALCSAEGIDFSLADKYGKTAMGEAAMFGKNKMLGKMLDAGADIETFDGNGSSPLASACMYGDKPETVKFLLERGADPDSRDRHGYTPLMEAAIAPAPEAAGLLLGAGANVNAQNKYGETALELARHSLGKFKKTEKYKWNKGKYRAHLYDRVISILEGHGAE